MMDLWELVEEKMEGKNDPHIYYDGNFEKYDGNQHKHYRIDGAPIGLLLFKKRHSLGLYYGKNRFLTTAHSVLLKNDENTQMERDVENLFFILFPSDRFHLIYKGDLKNSVFSTEKDLYYIQLIGNTCPLGQGLHSHIDCSQHNDELYFEKFDFIQLQIIRESRQHFQRTDHYNAALEKVPELEDNEFLLTKHGTDGESGSPIFSKVSGALVGIYKGECGFNYDREYKIFGRGIEIISPEAIAQANQRRMGPPSEPWFLSRFLPKYYLREFFLASAAHWGFRPETL